jgi:hypothetical protein
MTGQYLIGEASQALKKHLAGVIHKISAIIPIIKPHDNGAQCNSRQKMKHQFCRQLVTDAQTPGATSTRYLSLK